MTVNLKKIVLAALAALMTMALAGAMAEEIVNYEHPINPYFEEAQVPQEAPADAKRAVFKAGSAMTIRGSRVDGGCDADTTWTIKVSGGVEPYEYRYYIVALETADGALTQGDPYAYQTWSDDNTYSFRFIAPGYYGLLVYVRDSEGNQKSGGFRVTVADASRLTVSQRVDQLISQCRAAGVTGDYETALWLHDWLIMNARYDYDYIYYGPDGVLMRGLGVCDSYSKAYNMLLTRAGIECIRITGGNHAWNAAKLNGDWVQIDTTWDDVRASDGPVSGYEMHIYFGVTDELMQIDHSYTPTVACTSLKQNYYIRSGKVSLWTDALREDTLKGLGEGHYAFDVALPYTYKLENGVTTRSNAPIVYTLAHYAMNQQRSFDFGGQTLPMTFDLSIPEQKLAAQIDFGDHITALPSAVKTVQESAFEGDSGIMYASLSGATSIGAKAFSGCTGLWRVDLPQKSIDISDTAFEGLTHVTLVGPEGSAAQFYAQAHGLFWEKG